MLSINMGESRNTERDKRPNLISCQFVGYEPPYLLSNLLQLFIRAGLSLYWQKLITDVCTSVGRTRKQPLNQGAVIT
ncbi:hypothetical protein ACRALDRAFT_2017743 [Sodiomyces alcalophilus JCM 7366]|uniref:uncharacterized protein n=1 Tax=Sodiomyces alcalophilus JCM 7366 TaxID=591952 RepID=UPI0039B40CD8